MASTSASASTSSNLIPQWNYDVFLSFRGEDTRFTFTDHLYANLIRKGIHTFRDDSLKRGEEIAPELLKVIEESRFALIVFSENYAGSKWCLDEVVKIMECKKEMKQTVIPIFYHVDPSHVRNQTERFGEAFSNYKKDTEEMKEKVRSWRRALTEAANLSGQHVKDGYESEHIKKTVDNIFRRLNCRMIDVATNLVGMDSHVNEILRRLCIDQLNDVRVIGICGIGGMGKTTMAKVVYNNLSHEFEYMSFLENVRETCNTMGLCHKQNQLLCDLLELENKQRISSVGQGANMIKNVLQSKRVFIAFDDIDDPDQLEYLLRDWDWLGKGSRVIITTKSKHLLQETEDVYEVERLNFEQAYELFSLYAFRQNLPNQDFIHLSNSVVSYCHGLPLALKVIGSLLFNKTILQWKSELHKLKREPEMEIQNVLKISFDGLDHIQKKIFLDIACFFKGEEKDSVSRILDSCDLCAEIGIQVLYDKSLIYLSENKIVMHDLIQEMGRQIVRGQFPDNPEKWSKLWDPSDVCLAFAMKKGMKKVEAILLDLSGSKQLNFSCKIFAKMKRLRLLKIYWRDHCDSTKNEYKVVLPEDFQFPSHELRYLYWKGYPLKSLPSNFHGENLVELNMMDSDIKQLWQGNKSLGKLKILNLRRSKQLTELSNFPTMPNLGQLELASCTSLNIIDPSIGVLKNLTLLDLCGCENLTSLPSSIQYLNSLETVYLNDCSNLEKFPEMKEGSMKALSNLHFDGSAIKELPSSIEYLTGLEELYMRHCKNLRSLPGSICKLKSLKTLHVFGCSNLDTFPEIMEDMEYLEYLDLGGTAIKEIPSWICRLKFIWHLSLMGCSGLQSLPENIGDMEYLERLYLGGTPIKELPLSTQNLKGLKTLSLDKCKNLATLPNGIYNLRSLQYLRLLDCSNLEKFPKNLQGLCSLVHLNLSGCNLMEGLIPTAIGCLYSLEILDLSRNHMVNIPSGIAQLRKLRYLFINHCKMLREIPEIPSSLEYIDAHDSMKLEMLSSPSLLWSFLLKWFKPSSHEHWNYQLRTTIIIPGNGGIPSWVLYQGIGSQVRIEPPSNWFEDDQFLGFAFFLLYHSDPLNVPDLLLVTFYTKNAIRENYCRNQPPYFLDPLHHEGFTHPHIKRWGVQIIYTHDYLNNVPKLLDHQRGDDDS